MKNEERAKYFLVDIFKNSRFNQAIEENKNLVIDCYKLVSYDRFFMLELRDIIVNSGEDIDYSDPITNLLHSGIFKSAYIGSILKLREFICLKYSKKSLNDLINFLKHETDPQLHEFTKVVFKESEKLNYLINSSYENIPELYETLYERYTELLKKLEKVNNKKDYEEIVKEIKWEEKK